MELRPYQKKTVSIILENIRKGVKSQLINSPTGSGKTFISANVIKELNLMGLKVWFIVANEPLIKQTYNEFSKFNLQRSIIKSGMDKYFNPYAQNQIAMLQTLVKRLDKTENIKPDVLFFDEADFCSKGKMVQKIKETYPNTQIIGVTGTPTNHAGYLLKGFEFYHEVISVKELQKLGFLSIDKNFVPLNPNLENVRVMSTGEFNEEDLDVACNQTYMINDIVETYKKVNCGYKGIVFAINVNHAERLQKAFCDAGIKAGLIHSKMKKFQRDYWLEAHKRGKIQLLVNVGILTRGYNDVDIIDCIFARPTNSLPLYLQSVGRLARLDTEGKHFFRHFDYAGNISRFGLWSESRLYSYDIEVKKEIEFRPIVCPSCFSVIYEKTNKCPECDFILKQQQEQREREIQDNLRAKAIIEIKSATGSIGAIDALTKLLGKNGNTFYYTKLLSMKPNSISDDTFNSEVIRVANYARRQHYNPNYVYYKIRDKLCLTNKT